MAGEEEVSMQYEERYSDDILDSLQQLDLQDGSEDQAWINAHADSLVEGYDDPEWDKLTLPQQHPPMYTYQYQANNPEVGQETDSGSAYTRGLEHFSQDRVAEAIQCFESSLQLDPAQDECWRHLGLCWAERDEDARAIVCYNKALELDAYNMDALIGLGNSIYMCMSVYMSVFIYKCIYNCIYIYVNICTF